MDDTNKKPTFEPISQEEAKKIRAFEDNEGNTLNSGVDCGSGFDGIETPCLNKPEGADCCYFNNGEEHHGKCVYYGSDPVDSFMSMKCIVHPTDVPRGK